MGSLVTFKDIMKAHQRIRPFVKETPVMTCEELNKIANRRVYMKAEHLQSTGSFKVRGALNAILALKETSDHVKGVVTHSSGNHGQALAWAAAKSRLSCTIVVPRGSSACKTEAIRGYGAELVECEPTPTARAEATQRIASETGSLFISPFDDPFVIAGQGTVGVELLTQVPALDALFVAVSGGGLSSGIAIAAKALKPNLKVYLVTPKGKMLESCLRSGERLWPNPPQFLDTIADALRLQQLGNNTFPILLELAEKEVFEMGNEEIISAMKFVFHRMKQVIEPAAGAAVAAVLSDKMAALPEDVREVGVILCGGNVDIDNLPWCLGNKSC